ncbi:MAG TPA: TorF family putative porin [Caldimonas sp.]
MKKSLILLPLLVAIAPAAQAQTTPAAPAAAASAPEPTPSPFTANIALTTKYKFRGQDQGNTNWASPAVQGGFDWSQNGWYLGNWNSNVSFSNAAIEMDFYGGYKGEIVKDVGYDVGILQYYYPQKDRIVDFNTTELYGALSWQWLSLKYSHTVSKDYFGIGEAQQQAAFNNDGVSIGRPKGRNTGYLDLSANYPLVDKWTLNAHIGYTRYASDLRDAGYTVVVPAPDSLRSRPLGVATTTAVDLGVPNFYDYKIGVTYDLGSGFAAAAAYVGASKRSFYGDINKPRAILTLSKTM